MTFGQRLRELREKRSVRQADVADAIGVSAVMIVNYEKDSKLPQIEKLKLLANYFGVTVDYLLGDETTIDALEEEFPEGVQVLRRASKELSPEAKKKMIQIMKAFLEEE